jgi:antitoxin (DNA-binding transcriptional repressor) of toxin-antitoxin stability system
METRISAIEAARKFSDIVNRVRCRGEEFIVERAGEAVCRIVPTIPVKRTLADLVRILDSAPKPDSEYWDIVEKVTRHQPKLPRRSWWLLDASAPIAAQTR